MDLLYIPPILGDLECGHMGGLKEKYIGSSRFVKLQKQKRLGAPPLSACRRAPRRAACKFLILVHNLILTRYRATGWPKNLARIANMGELLERSLMGQD